MKNKKTILIISLIIIAISAGGLWYFKNKTSNNQEIFQEQEGGEEVVNGGDEDFSNAEKWPEQEYTEEDYEGWKTFIHEELGYEIKYPSDWTLKDLRGASLFNLVTITPPQPENFIGYFSIFFDNRNIEEIREVYTNPEFYSDSVPDCEKKIMFNGNKGYLFYRDTNLMKSREIFIPHNNLLYSISTQKYNIPEVPQIFASFKFIR